MTSHELVCIYQRAERRWFSTRLRRVAHAKFDGDIAKYGKSVGWDVVWKERFCIRACTLISLWQKRGEQ